MTDPTPRAADGLDAILGRMVYGDVYDIKKRAADEAAARAARAARTLERRDRLISAAALIDALAAATAIVFLLAVTCLAAWTAVVA